MIDSYWDLYVAYIAKCVRDNWINDIDPHHYEMEWNHWLPKACFPDLPLGQWLTKRQHAIASALQTLALGENCMCAWHKKDLPKTLLELAWPIYCEVSRIKGSRAAEKLNAQKDDFGRSVMAVKGGERAHSEKDSSGKSINGVKSAERLNKEKDEFGRSVQAVKGGLSGCKITHARKDGLGRSVIAVRASERLNSEKDERGKSLVGVKAANRMNSEIWESTIDGFRSNLGNVVSHNRRRGWDPNARKRVG